MKISSRPRDAITPLSLPQAQELRAKTAQGHRLSRRGAHSCASEQRFPKLGSEFQLAPTKLSRQGQSQPQRLHPSTRKTVCAPHPRFRRELPPRRARRISPPAPPERRESAAAMRRRDSVSWNFQPLAKFTRNLEPARATHS